MHLYTITIFPTLRETEGTVTLLVKMISSDCMKSKPKFKSQFKYGRLYITIEFGDISFKYSKGMFKRWVSDYH